jgi:hypothetical protein
VNENRFDSLARVFAGGGTRRTAVRLLAALPFASSLAVLLDEGDAARADGSVAGVGGGHRRRHRRLHRRHARHRHHPGDNKDNRQDKRKGRRKAKRNRLKASCALCRTGETCTKGVCFCGGGPGCTGAGEICQSGICHNPYGCTPELNFCTASDPFLTRCPGNPNGLCLNAPEGQFCIDIALSQCAPGGDCAACAAGTDCITIGGGICTCPDGSTKGCAVPPPPP